MTISLNKNPLKPHHTQIDSRSLFLGIVYTLLAFAYIYRALYIIEYQPMRHIWSDPQRHWEQGVDVMRDDPMTLTDPVVYQLYISTLAKLTYGNHTLVAFYTILLAFLMPWLWYRFFRELQPSRDIALAGWAAIAWLPSWLSIYAYFMQETLMLPLLGAAFWATWRSQRKGTLNAFLIMVFIWCIAGLTRGIAIPLAAVAASWLWFTQPQKISKAVYSLVIFALVLGPLAYRSMDKMHIVAPNGIGKLNVLYAQSGKKEIQINYHRQGARWVYGYGSPSTGTKPLEPFSDWQTAREGKVIVRIDVDKGSEDWEKEAAKHSLSWQKYWWLTGESLIFLFFDPSWPDSNKDYTLGLINHHTRWLWAPLGLLCIGLTILMWRRGYLPGSKVWLLPALIVAWFIVQGFIPIAVSEGRYRKPFEGLAIAQLVLLAGYWRSRRELQRQTQEPSEDLPSEVPDAKDEISNKTGAKKA